MNPRFLMVMAGLVATTCRAQAVLPSWNDTAPRNAIVEFVERVSKPDGPGFVPPAARIAVFDNDGTLWAEQPMYVQLVFTLDRVTHLAPRHPEWKDKEPFKSVLAGDAATALAGGEKSVVELVSAAHAGITTDEFAAMVAQWIAITNHPRTDRPYTDMAYRPMLELLAYLRANGFKTYIVSGGGVEFMRPRSERVYGVPPEQVIGSTGKLAYELKDGKPALMKLPEIDHVDDGPGKPVGIHRSIGRRPIAAFGNSDGDLQMLQWTTLPQGDGDSTPRFALIVHHTDADREWAYDRESRIGRLDKALDEARARGWTVVDMKKDWRRVFAFEAP